MTGPRLRFVRPGDRSPAPQPTARPEPPAAQPAPAPAGRGFVVHAAWVPPVQDGPHQLALWAEAERPATRLPSPRGRGAGGEGRERAHPSAARRAELLALLERLWRMARPGVRPRSTCAPGRLRLWLPADGAHPLPSPELVRAGWAPDPALAGVDPDAAPLALWRVEALFLDVESAGTLLAGLPHGAGAELDAAEGTSWSGPSHTARALLGVDARFWSAAAKLVLDLLARQRFLPGVSRLPDAPGGYDPYDGYYGYSRRTRGPRLVGAWFAALGDPQDRARFDALAAAMPGLCRAPVPAGLDEPDPEAVPGARALLEDFAHCVVNARVQRWIGLDRLDLVLGGPADDPYHRYDVGLGYYGARPLGSLTERWLRGLQVADVPIYTTAAEASELQEGIRRWHAGTSGVDGAAFRLCFRLAPPDGPPEGVDASGASDADAEVDGADPAVAAAGEVAPDDGAAAAAQPPRLLIERPDDAPARAPEIADALAPDAPVAEAPGDGGSWRLDYLLQARDDPSLLVPLAEVWRARGSSARFLDRRFDRPHERVLTSLGQAAHLCEPIAASLGQAHPIGCDLDGAQAYRFLREALPLLEEAGFGVLVPAWWKRVAPRPTVRLRLRGPQKTSSGLLGLDAVLGYDWRLALGDQELSPEDLERLVALKEPLVRVRGQWVELRPEQVEAALAFARAHPGGHLSLGEALRASLTGELGEGEMAVEEVRADEWIGDLLGRLRSGEALAEVPSPAALHGTLRPYQLRGLGWLAFLSRYGLGSCLADDMGLGKCLAACQKVSTLSGPVTIESFWERKLSRIEPDGEGGEWGALAQPILVNTFDGREIVATPVRRVYRQRIAEPCVEVHLGDGSHLSSTRRHRYLTPTGWKMAGELKIGELVGIAARTPHVGASDMTSGLAELMAWQLAEGYERDRPSVGIITNGDLQALGRVRDLACICGIELPTPRQHSNGQAWIVGTVKLRPLFERWGYSWGHLSSEKEVPRSVLEAAPDAQRAFIQALFDAEGHVNRTHCEITMASEQVIYALQTMLRNFGVWGRIRRAMKSATNGRNIKRPYYTLTFGSNSVVRFAEQFQFSIPRKQQALEALAAIRHNSNVEGVPTQAVVAAMQQQRIALRSVGLRTVYEWQGMGRPLAASVATQLRTRGHDDLAQQIDDLAAPGVHWCAVKDVREFPYEGYVYDLEVPTTHNYIAEGIVTHNTVQLLSLMLHEKAEGNLTKPVLLVCPTSVVGNWRHETARFAPDLRLLVHHGAGRVGRAAAARFAAEVAGYDLVVTTYSLLHRDEPTLATAEWGAVVLDEAQNIKNVEAKQSRSARRLEAPVRVALTGTPVENRLGELWSIMDFLNPGYLGSHRRFHEQFAAPIENLRDPRATGRLQALVRPFVLRRLKTDPTVINDLPEKLEMREYVPLTREQVTLYEAVVRDGLRQLEETESPMQRRGVVLAMLTKLKQVCNHPAHFLGDDSALSGRSGKLTRLEELIEELRAEGDRALIFTQFTAMGDRLRPYLQERFDTEVLYLHGAVPLRQREHLVARFQAEDGPPLFLLSLKAGGTGLNLTRANHVIHFDRWWNPAVENQATDRAFRIGQTRNVQVRKFVCTGTLEERIDAMIEQKRELAEKVIGTGEEWITEMSTDQLRELFSLRADALAD